MGGLKAIVIKIAELKISQKKFSPGFLQEIGVSEGRFK